MYISGKACFLVLCGHRTGSSLTARLLETLGVPMGGPGHKAESNPDGHFEDEMFVNLHRAMFNEIIPAGYDPAAWAFPRPVIRPEHIVAYRALIESRSGQRVWGYKDPRTVAVADFAIGLLWGTGCTVLPIFVERHLDDVVASLKARDGDKLPGSAIEIAVHQQKLLGEAQRRFAHLNHLRVAYDDLVHDPEGVVGQMAAFIRQTIPVPREQIDTAVSLVRRA